MKYSSIGIVAALCLAGLHDLGLASDQVPGAPQSQPIAIVGGTVHRVSGEVIESGIVLFENGLLTGVAKTLELPEGTQEIRADGKHIYPSLIEAYSNIGLVEINAVAATIDSREIGSLNPNVQAVIAFNPDSELIPVNRAAGVLLAITAPSGGTVSGRSSLMMLDGWTRVDMAVKLDTGMHVRWPRNADGVQELQEFLEQARRYVETRAAGDASSQPIDLRLSAMQAVLDGSLPMIVDADGMEEIQAAVAFATRWKLKLIIYGGADAAYCAELLKAADVSVILSAVYRNPSRRHSSYDEAYALPKKLQDAGVTFCISAGGRFGASGIRNLPYNAATAAAYGLTEEQALRSITLSPAEILGVSDRVGALRPGLDATLIVTDGNILETPTQVELAFVQGRKVDLNNRHTQLYGKYSEKYRRLQEATR